MGNSNGIKQYTILQSITLQKRFCSPLAFRIARPVVQRIESAKSRLIELLCILILSINFSCRCKQNPFNVMMPSQFQYIDSPLQIALHNAHRIRIDKIRTGIPCQMEYIVHLSLIGDRLADILNQKMEIRLTYIRAKILLCSLAIPAKRYYRDIDSCMLMQIEQQPSDIRSQHTCSPSNENRLSVKFSPWQPGLTHPL